jgi:hypothetical protein
MPANRDAIWPARTRARRGEAEPGRRTLLAVLACALFVTSPARAHLGHVIARAERYLKLDISGSHARVVVSLTLGEGEGRRVLEAADEDGDGSVDERERDVYLAAWARGLATELPIRVDDQPVQVVWGEGYMEPIGRVEAVPVTVELVAQLALDGGPQRVRIEDRMVRREVYERTDVAFRARDGARLVASGAEEAPAELTEDLVYDGTFERGRPVPLVAIVETPAPPGRFPWPLAAGAAALVIASLSALLWRRRRSSPESKTPGR